MPRGPHVRLPPFPFLWRGKGGRVGHISKPFLRRWLFMKSVMKWTKTQSAVASCNVSYNRNIDAETLVGILSGDMPMDHWLPHIDIFFNELPYPYIYGVLSENNLSLK
jgi:hypothetical protein